MGEVLPGKGPFLYAFTFPDFTQRDTVMRETCIAFANCGMVRSFVFVFMCSSYVILYLLSTPNLVKHASKLEQDFQKLQLGELLHRKDITQWDS